MAWATPSFPPSQVDRAGKILTLAMTRREKFEEESSWEEFGHALSVINNWRSSHAFPLNTFQTGLRGRARRVFPNAIVAQRLKRLWSISNKLRNHSVRLSQMQDIGGCRAVVGSIRNVNAAVELYQKSDIRHELTHKADYILQPRTSGYRSVHLVYRYFSDKKQTYNGLKIEIQLRSTLQHAWATAVETVGTFTRQALKSSRGEDDWLRFFALMGSALALRERTTLVPGTPVNERELVSELQEYSKRLKVIERLRAYGAALQEENLDERFTRYVLLSLDADAERVTVKGYEDLRKATEDYLSAEERILDEPNAEVVLVSVGSLGSLRRAFPNYFLDTSLFIDAVEQAIKRKPNR